MLRTRPCLTLPVLYNLTVSFLKPTYIKLRWKPSGLLSYNICLQLFSLSQILHLYFHTFCQYWFIIVRRGREACTEVGRAPLIDFQKWFLNKVFYRLKLFRKFKFYTCMTISFRKSVKKGQKMTKKTQIWFITRFPIFFCLG